MPVSISPSGLGRTALAPLTLNTVLPSLPPLPALTPVAAVQPAATVRQVLAVAADKKQPEKPVLTALTATAAAAPKMLQGQGAGLKSEAGRSFDLNAPAPVEVPVRRGKPAIQDVSFSEDVASEDQELFLDTLHRRKAGWFRGVSSMGIRLDGPVAPRLEVVSSKRSAARVDYEVGWNQGKLHLGAFRVRVQLKDLNPSFYRLPAPEPPAEKQLTLRLRKASPEGIAAFLENNGLRVLSRYQDAVKVAVTDDRTAAQAAAELTGTGIVFYATPAKLEIAQKDQVEVVFSAADENAVASVLKRHGLSVISSKDGLWRLGGDSPSVARLNSESAVLYARPVIEDIPFTRQSIVKFQPAPADEFAAYLRRSGLRVLEELGDDTYRVGFLKARAALTGIVSSVEIGSLSDEAVRSAAAGTASYKGRPWSSTEYSMNWYYAYRGLKLRGATPEQLELFEKLTAEAPVRGGGFNPWSGD